MSGEEGIVRTRRARRSPDGAGRHRVFACRLLATSVTSSALLRPTVRLRQGFAATPLLNPTALGILELLGASARRGANAPAVVTACTTLGHAALRARVGAQTRRLTAGGIGPGSVVGLTVADEVAHLIATLALIARGARQIVLASHDAPALRDAVARRVGLTHRLTDADVEPCAAADAGFEVEAEADPASDLVDHSAEALLYLKTSGTTGDVNLVAYTLADLQAQASRHAEYAGERLLRLAAIEHNNSKRHRLYAVLLGGTNVFARPLPTLVACVERLGVTCLDISRLHAADLAASRTRLPAGVKLRTGGSAIPARLRRELLQHVTPNLYVRYAATECGAIAMAGPDDQGAALRVENDDVRPSPENGDVRPWSDNHDARPSPANDDAPAGRPLSGVALRILGPDDRVLGVGESGRIAVRAPGMASRYVDHDAQTAARFRDGWFCPGDVGYLRADGQLVVQGRGDDMIILNGLNIFPAEIERVLEAHPAVDEAAAFGLASGVHGQIPVAAVALRAGCRVEAVELRRHARERLGLRAPRRVLLLDALPRNAQGKVSRLLLRQSFERTLRDEGSP